MRCPMCGGKCACRDSRWVQETWRQRRRHVCRVCGNRFTTFEVCDGQHGGLITAKERVQLRATAAELRRRADALERIGRGVEIAGVEDNLGEEGNAA